jgi:hypothetical protein
MGVGYEVKLAMLLIVGSGFILESKFFSTGQQETTEM